MSADPILVPANLPAVMTVPEVCSLLKLDRRTVYAMLDSRELEGSGRTGKGRPIRVWTASVVRWVRGGATAPLAPAATSVVDSARGKRRVAS